MISIPLIMASFEGEGDKPDYLPKIEITPKLQHEINKEHASFLTELYITSKKNLSLERREWFLQEIGLTIAECYPHLSRSDLVYILQKIEKHGEEQ